MAHVAAFIRDHQCVGIVQINRARDFAHASRLVEHRDLVAAIDRVLLRIEALKVVAEEAVSHPDVSLLVHPERAGLHAFGVRRKLVRLVVAVSIRVPPDGSPRRLVRRPFKLGVIEIVAPLEDQAGRYREFAFVAKDVDEVAGEHAADEQEPLAFQIDNLRRGQPVFALLLYKHQSPRIIRITVAIERVTDPSRFAASRFRVVHDVVLLDAPDIAPISGGIGACKVHEAQAVKLPKHLAVRRKLAQHRPHLAHGDVEVAGRVHAHAADAPELGRGHFAGRAGADAAALAEHAGKPGMVGIGHVIKQHLLPRTGERIGDHELPIIGECQGCRLEQFRESHVVAVALYALRHEVPFLVLGIHAGDDQHPMVAGLVRDFEAVGLHVLVADHVAILVNAEPVPAFVPVAPGVDCAIGLNLGINKEVLHPAVAGTRKGIAQPGCLVTARGRLNLGASCAGRSVVGEGQSGEDCRP